MYNLIKVFIVASMVAVSGQALAAGEWYPSRFGTDDQAGATNLMTSAKAMQAAGLIKSGTVISIGRTYEADMPLFGSRVFALRATGGLAGGPFGNNKVIWMDDFLATEIGQVGTQFDGLGHIGIGGEPNRFYNGLEASSVVGTYGLKKLGVEHLKPFFTRGVLIDMVALKGRNMNVGEEITVADIEQALAKQGTADVGEGDVVIIHTGHGSLWIKDNATFNSGEPGIGLDAARYLIGKGIALVGADTWAVEVVPNPDSNVAFPVHQELLTKNGVFIHENLATERLVEAGVYEFAYIFSPLPVKGATGSPGAPLAAW